MKIPGTDDGQQSSDGSSSETTGGASADRRRERATVRDNRPSPSNIPGAGPSNGGSSGSGDTGSQRSANPYARIGNGGNVGPPDSGQVQDPGGGGTGSGGSGSGGGGGGGSSGGGRRPPSEVLPTPGDGGTGAGSDTGAGSAFDGGARVGDGGHVAPPGSGQVRDPGGSAQPPDRPSAGGESAGGDPEPERLSRAEADALQQKAEAARDLAGPNPAGQPGVESERDRLTPEQVDAYRQRAAARREAARMGAEIEAMSRPPQYDESTSAFLRGNFGDPAEIIEDELDTATADYEVTQTGSEFDVERQEAFGDAFGGGPVEGFADWFQDASRPVLEDVGGAVGGAIPGREGQLWGRAGEAVERGITDVSAVPKGIVEGVEAGIWLARPSAEQVVAGLTDPRVFAEGPTQEQQERSRQAYQALAQTAGEGVEFAQENPTAAVANLGVLAGSAGVGSFAGSTALRGAGRAASAVPDAVPSSRLPSMPSASFSTGERVREVAARRPRVRVETDPDDALVEVSPDLREQALVSAARGESRLRRDVSRVTDLPQEIDLATRRFRRQLNEARISGEADLVERAARARESATELRGTLQPSSPGEGRAATAVREAVEDIELPSAPNIDILGSAEVSSAARLYPTTRRLSLLSGQAGKAALRARRRIGELPQDIEFEARGLWYGATDRIPGPPEVSRPDPSIPDPRSWLTRQRSATELANERATNNLQEMWADVRFDAGQPSTIPARAELATARARQRAGDIAADVRFRASQGREAAGRLLYGEWPRPESLVPALPRPDIDIPSPSDVTVRVEAGRPPRQPDLELSPTELEAEDAGFLISEMDARDAARAFDDADAEQRDVGDGDPYEVVDSPDDSGQLRLFRQRQDTGTGTDAMTRRSDLPALDAGGAVGGLGGLSAGVAFDEAGGGGAEVGGAAGAGEVVDRATGMEFGTGAQSGFDTGMDFGTGQEFGAQPAAGVEPGSGFRAGSGFDVDAGSRTDTWSETTGEQTPRPWQRTPDPDPDPRRRRDLDLDREDNAPSPWDRDAFTVTDEVFDTGVAQSFDELTDNDSNGNDPLSGFDGLL